MKMISSRKGIMFTIMSVLVCALIITTFFTYQSVSLDKDVDNIKLRIKSIDRFAVDADTYVAGVTYASGKATLNFTLEAMIEHNLFLDNYTKEVVSCMMTGNMSVPWSANQVICPEDAYLKGKFSEFEDFSNSNLNLNSDITLNSVRVEQSNPWSIDMYVNYTITINDTYAFWNETRVVKDSIGIQGLKDPLYAIVNSTSAATSDLYNVRNTNHVINVSKTEAWNEMPSTAHNIIVNDSYFAWSNGPSFLDRADGRTDFMQSQGMCVSGIGYCGIVSVVPYSVVGTYSSLNGDILRSNVDYEFWRGNDLNAGEASYSYRRYDFYKMGYEQRNSYGVISENANRGLNGSVLPYTLMEYINMTDTDYTDFVYLADES